MVDPIQKAIVRAMEAERRLDAAGIAQIGGHFGPHYLDSFVVAAGLVVRHATTVSTVALAGVHLQRHALELMIKALLEMLHAVEDWRVVLDSIERQAWSPLSIPERAREDEDLHREHDVEVLLKHLRAALARSKEHYELRELDPELGHLVEDLTKLERRNKDPKSDASRWRYPSVKVPKHRRTPNGENDQHEPSFPEAVLVHVGDFQARLEHLRDSLFKTAFTLPIDSLGQELDVVLRGQLNELRDAGAFDDG